MRPSAARAPVTSDRATELRQVDDHAVRLAAGATARAPRWAMAAKFAAVQRTTELLAIEVRH